MRKLLNYTLATYLKEIPKVTKIVEIMKFRTKKILLLILNIREKCDRRNNSRVARIYNKSYYSNNEFNYNYSLKSIICKHGSRHISADSNSFIIFGMNKVNSSKCLRDTLLGVFQ